MTVAEFVEALLLGVVQGVTEFLPVSSSGHLVIAGELIRRYSGRSIDADGNLQLNIAVHLGTLFSIVVVYQRDLRQLLRHRRLCTFIVLATIPVVVAALLFEDVIKENLQTPLSVGMALLVTAGLLFRADGAPGGAGTMEHIRPLQVGVVGVLQAMALVPGISRSGSTISGGMLSGMKPEEAARFSFLLAIPAIAGAVVYLSWEMVRGEGGSNPPSMLLVGALTAFVVGWLSLRWLIHVIRRRQLRWFAWYCLIVAAVTIVWQLAEWSAV